MIIVLLILLVSYILSIILASSVDILDYTIRNKVSNVLDIVQLIIVGLYILAIIIHCLIK